MAAEFFNKNKGFSNGPTSLVHAGADCPNRSASNSAIAAATVNSTRSVQLGLGKEEKFGDSQIQSCKRLRTNRASPRTAAPAMASRGFTIRAP